MKKDEPYKYEIFSHDLFNALSEIIKQSDKLSFEDSKTMIGRSLREDFSDINNPTLSDSIIKVSLLFNN
jgi:hypothetical protein